MIDENLIDYTDEKGLNAPWITAREYEEATKTVVRTIGREAKCDVIFAGDDAKAGVKNSNRIVQLPINPPDQPLSKRQYFIGQGYANHETLHNLCTDIEGLAPRMTKIHKHKQHLTMALCQAVEDMRIERAGGEMYPGIPNKLAATAQFAAEKFLAMPDDERNELVGDFKKIGPIAMTWEGRKRMGYHSPALDKCIAAVDPKVMDTVRKYMDVVDKLPTGVTGIGVIDRVESFKGSHKVVDLAEVIAREVMQDPDEKEEGDGGGGGDEGGGGDDGTGGGGNKGSDGRCGAGNSEEFIPFDPDMLKYVLPELKAQGAINAYRPYTTALDVWVKRGSKTDAARRTLHDPSNMKRYNDTMKKMTGKLAVMRRKLERALQAKMDMEYVGGYRTGKLRLTGSVPVKVMQNKQNIFRRREGGKDIDAAVTLLIDASGSMSNRRIALAQESAIALAEAIARVGVPLEVLVFNTRMPSKDEVPGRDEIVSMVGPIVSAARTGGMHFARTEPISMYEVKSFDDNMNIARMGMGGIVNMVASSNADGESVLKAWDRLKVRKEKNRVLMVLSDGQPSCAGDGNQQHQHLANVIEAITEEGGHCIGIGIQSECVKQYYPQYSVVNVLEDLTGACIENIARMLLGDRYIADNSKLLKADASAARKKAA